ncbi:MAG TPA: ABC transporter ATP-binding protein [Lentimicrobium sp.]|nr:ABC transporter ATP-binding protein [Lentimicrobium sp.]
MIIINNLNVSYEKETPVLSSVDLSFQNNSIHGIVGLNGAGKTTLLNTIYGIKKNDSGEILLNGQKINRKYISYLETENYFYPNITGEEHLKIFKSDGFNIAQWNELFKLPLKDLIDTYSTGMKKKLAILSVIKQNKEVMILDEPFNGLDLETVRILRSILLNLKESRIIIVTSHVLETLTNLCDVISYLEDGKVLFTKTVTEFPDFQNEIYRRIEERNKEAIEKLTY